VVLRLRHFDNVGGARTLGKRAAAARALSEQGYLSRTGTPFVAMQISRWLRRNSGQ
jgi:hypothetical protein